MRTLTSCEHLKDVQVMKMRIFYIFLKKMSEIVNTFFLSVYIIKILGRSIKIMCENYRFMCDIFKTFIWNFAIKTNIWFKDFIIKY